MGRAFETDLISSEEGLGYSMASRPHRTEYQCDYRDHHLDAYGQSARQSDVDITLTDAAGNVRSETLTITVADAPTAEVQLEITDLAGNNQFDFCW